MTFTINYLYFCDLALMNEAYLGIIVFTKIQFNHSNLRQRMSGKNKEYKPKLKSCIMVFGFSVYCSKSLRRMHIVAFGTSMSILYFFPFNFLFNFPICCHILTCNLFLDIIFQLINLLTCNFVTVCISRVCHCFWSFLVFLRRLPTGRYLRNYVCK